MKKGQDTARMFLLYWWSWDPGTLSVSECDGREWKGATHPVSQHTYTWLSVLLQERTKRDWKGRKGAPQCFGLIMFWVSVSSGLDEVKGQDRPSLWPITVSFIECLQRKNKSPEILHSRLAMEAYSLQDKTVKGNSRSPNAKDSYYQVEQIREGVKNCFFTFSQKTETPLPLFDHLSFFLLKIFWIG